MKARYIIGIDLGTTNSAVGYVDLHEAAPGAIQIHSFEIPQLVGHGRIGRRPTLPSFLYIPGGYDLNPGDIALPWDPDRDYVVGTFARDQGSLVPNRLVSSAKSWLCHGGVDREAPILPWGAGTDVKKVSPVTASSRYLQHIKEAWNHSMPEPLERQHLILTVPASFDEVARELTLKAASEAGLTNVTLLEEPLAAFYAWLAFHEADWKKSLSVGDLLLVCDVGGGTTDFTLIACLEGKQGPRLERVAVGDHLLLGGDNMDLTLAALAEKELKQELDQARWHSLIHQSRQAKERLLEEEDLETAAIRLTGRGRSLIGGTLVVRLEKKRVQETILEGFFPVVDLKKDLDSGPMDTGLREMGLPYVSDPAVTRHLARFITRQGKGRFPTLVLFNGGALKPRLVRKRILEVLSTWAGRKVVDLDSRSLDLAISWGAAYYGLVRHGLGLRVGGGTARAYYVGVSTRDGEKKAVCLVERGTEENVEVELSESLMVRTNRPVRFTIYSSTTRTGDKAGDLVPADSEDLVRLPPVQTVLKYGKKSRDVTIPVVVGAKVTAIGTLELYCKSKESPHRWRLQFRLRSEEQQEGKRPVEHIEGVRIATQRPSETPKPKDLTEDDLEAISQARDLITRCFSKKDQIEPISPQDLPRLLTRCFGMEKDLWPLSALRLMADHLLELQNGRGRSSGHESRWFNLTGFCMRPGLGEASDPWRIKKIWPLVFQGLVFQRDQGVRLQWWIFWRRVAAGLSTGQQTQLFSSFSRAILPRPPSKSKRRKKGKMLKVSPEERREMWFCASNLERIEVSTKIEMGEALLKLLKKQRAPWILWSLSRIGARQPLYGPADKVVPPGTVTQWLERIKRMELPNKDALSRAIVSMARITGDRARDLTSQVRQDLLTYLGILGVPDAMTKPLKEFIPIATRERTQAFGERLPEGLILDSQER